MLLFTKNETTCNWIPCSTPSNDITITMNVCQKYSTDTDIKQLYQTAIVQLLFRNQ